MRYLRPFSNIVIAASFVTILLAGCETRSVDSSLAPTPSSVSPIPVDLKVPENNDKTVDLSIESSENEPPAPSTDPENHEPTFAAEEISDEVFERMRGKSYPEDCPVELSELRYLRLSYKDIDGNSHEGEMVCNASIADKLVEIFRTLYENDYPIEHMSLVDDYDADDETSMSANNTSCFNFRYISGTKKISKHGEGLAVDINPRYNPYVKEKDGSIHVEPVSGAAYTDRALEFDYKIDENDLAYKLFTEAGFTWGGSWKSVKDYQHFEYSLQ